MADFGGSNGSAAVSLQLHIVHTYEYHHTKGEPLSYLMKAAVPKTTASAPLFDQ